MICSLDLFTVCSTPLERSRAFVVDGGQGKRKGFYAKAEVNQQRRLFRLWAILSMWTLFLVISYWGYGFAYDPQAAANYADAWCKNRNSTVGNVCDHYRVWDNDCANFVSQCLMAGGLNLNGSQSHCGCIITCDSLHNWLVNDLGAYHHERWTRSRVLGSDREPSWFVKGDVAIYGDYSDYYEHAVFAVVGDDNHYAECDAHSVDQHHKSVRYFFNYEKSWKVVTFYHIPTHVYPTVNAFSVGPESLILGDSFTICYRISDIGGSGLNWVQLWRATDTNSDGKPDWPDTYVEIYHLSGEANFSGVFFDSPSSVGTYWYGVHVGDNNGNWSVERKPPGPIEVTVR